MEPLLYVSSETKVKGGNRKPSSTEVILRVVRNIIVNSSSFSDELVKGISSCISYIGDCKKLLEQASQVLEASRHYVSLL